MRIRGTLDALVAPRSVALVGGSDDASRIGGRILARLRETFTGPIYPISPRRPAVQGLPTYRGFEALPDPVDLAIVVVPAPAVLPLARIAADCGTGALLVVSAGFSDSDDAAGALAQREMAAVGAASGMRICGPNCIGIVNLTLGLRAVFASLHAVPQESGAIALVSQSGGVGLTLFELAQASGLGVSYLVDTANEADVTSGEVLAHLAERPDVGTIGLFLESVRRPDLLLAGARRALELDKPVVALRAGGSPAGSRAATDHIGLPSCADDVLSAALDGVGVVRVAGPGDLVEQLRMFASAARPTGPRLAVLTPSGGTGVLLADAAEAAGLSLPEPSPTLAAALKPLVPRLGSVHNPIDLTAQIVDDHGRLRALLSAVATAPDFDAVCAAGVPRGLDEGLRHILARAAQEAAAVGRTLVTHSTHQDVARELQEGGIASFTDPGRMIAALGRAWEYERRRPDLLAGPPRFGALGKPQGDLPPGDPPDDAAVWRTLADPEVRLLLAGAGIPIHGERPEDGAAHDRHRTPGPASSGLRLVCAALRDPTFGPVVAVGLGGALGRVARERRVALAPLDHQAARELVAGLAGRWLGEDPDRPCETEIDAVADALTRLGDLLATDPAVLEIEIDPLTLTAAGPVAEAARVAAR